MASAAAKRAFDLVVAAVGLLVLAPMLALIGWRITRDSRGPVFYTQLRKGRLGRPFHIVKFRTMVVDAEARLAQVWPHNLHADPRLYKIANDPRVTPVGVILRRHSLDELPQLLNVLRGEMSLVGPRPLTLEEDRFVEGWARQRAQIRPGITGLWQVGGRNVLSFDDMMRLDCQYVARRSFVGDLGLLARTVPVVLRPQAAC